MDVRTIRLDDLVLDPNLNLRDRLDPETVERYADAWQRLPPVTVFEVDRRLLLADGLHRHAAAVRLKQKTIAAEVRPGTFADALDYVAGANLFHGLPLSRGERRRAIEVKLRLHHDRSDRALAEELAVGRELLSKVRRQLVEAGQIPANATRVGADGKSYPAAALPKDPNERRPTGFGDFGPDDPRDRGRTEADPAPWDDTVDPMPIGRSSGGPSAPWEDDGPGAGFSGGTGALGGVAAPASAAPTIDEMVALMTRQILEVVGWTRAEGFAEGYRSASAVARKRFQTATTELAGRADELRDGR